MIIVCLCLLLLAVVVWIIVVEFGFVPHVQRGFHCGDPSISHKYTGDTVSMKVIIGSIFMPFLLVWMSEAIFYKPSSIKSTRLRKSLCQSFFWFREYMIGISLHLFLVESIKVSGVETIILLNISNDPFRLHWLIQMY